MRIADFNPKAFGAGFLIRFSAVFYSRTSSKSPAQPGRRKCRSSRHSAIRSVMAQTIDEIRRSRRRLRWRERQRETRATSSSASESRRATHAKTALPESRIQSDARVFGCQAGSRSMPRARSVDRSSAETAPETVRCARPRAYRWNRGRLSPSKQLPASSI